MEGGYSAWVDSGLAGDKPAEELKTFCKFLQVGLLNVDGYYDSLLELFDKCRGRIHQSFGKEHCHICKDC
ncbi:hypothetical protein OIU79_031358 [Salix purpurea]|uniref:Cytokinin riboside 5'-monophosphate phosphoribohydrolase n=1 Tax=Salix purpurea TaxID=77065 RepID=A0A9Q0NIF4_SALPP|nr:hypothetical protein OIU79_031358 [Salix purpurea]